MIKADRDELIRQIAELDAAFEAESQCLAIGRNRQLANPLGVSVDFADLLAKRNRAKPTQPPRPHAGSGRFDTDAGGAGHPR